MKTNWTIIKVISAILFFIMFFGTAKLLESNSHKDFADRIKQESYSGVVFAKYIDSNRKSARTIVFEDHESLDIDIYNDLYDKIEFGDTILKKKGTLRLVLQNGMKYGIFYPSYFGETFYDSTTAK